MTGLIPMRDMCAYEVAERSKEQRYHPLHFYLSDDELKTMGLIRKTGRIEEINPKNALWRRLANTKENEGKNAIIQ